MVYPRFGVEVNAVDIVENFHSRSIQTQSIGYGLVSRRTFDLRTGWNLSCLCVRNSCWARLHVQDLPLIIVSPMRGPFFSLTMLICVKTRRMKAMYKEACEHLRFCASVYLLQYNIGKYFLHEHPLTATSWLLKFMGALRAWPRIDLIVGDQCLFGRGASYKDELGKHSWALVRERTAWLTNHPRFKVVLNEKCPNCTLPRAFLHKHIPALVGGRAKST